MATPAAGASEVYRPRRGKGCFVLFAALFATAFSTSLLGDPHVVHSAAVGVTAGLGVISLIIIVSLLPGSSFLRVGPDGLTIRLLWRTQSYGWQEFAEFGVIRVTSGVGGMSYDVVGLRFAPESLAASRYAGRLNRAEVGWDGVLHDAYAGITAEALAAHLNQLRRRALGLPEPTPPPPPTPSKSTGADEEEDED